MEDKILMQTCLLGFVIVGIPAIVFLMIGLRTPEDNNFLKTAYNSCITDKIESRKDLEMPKIKFICKLQAKKELERKNDNR